MGMTLAEKILARAAGLDQVKPGQVVDTKVDVAMSHEACVQVIDSFREMGATRVQNPDSVVIILDHWVPASNERSARMHKRVRDFVREMGIESFYDVGCHGICHQILAEDGWARPGRLIVGTDSHTPTAGGLGAFAAGIGPTDMAALLALGKLWLRVPENVRIDVRGELPHRVVGKDLILHILGKLGSDGAVYKAVEFTGETISGMNIAERLTICNMTAEMGAKTGIVAGDERTKTYLAERGKECELLVSDEDAVYQEEHSFTVSDLDPQVAVPHKVDNVHPVHEFEGKRIDQGFVGSCTNGGIEDLRQCAEILKGERVHGDVRLIITPASQKIYLQAVEEGLAEIFIEAGAIFTNSTCGACFGGHMGLLAPGEVCISSSNRNFKGRMGSPEAEIYLASPVTVAASSLYGEITDPREV